MVEACPSIREREKERKREGERERKGGRKRGKPLVAPTFPHASLFLTSHSSLIPPSPSFLPAMHHSLSPPFFIPLPPFLSSLYLFQSLLFHSFLLIILSPLPLSLSSYHPCSSLTYLLPPCPYLLSFPFITSPMMQLTPRLVCSTFLLLLLLFLFFLLLLVP